MCHGKVVKIHGIEVCKQDCPKRLFKTDLLLDTCYDPYDKQFLNNTVKMNGTLSPGDEYYR